MTINLGKVSEEMYNKMKSANREQVPDMVNKPPHYHKGKEGVDVHYFLEHFFPENGTYTVYEGFCIGQVIKYTSRHKEKGGHESLEKAEYYIKELQRLWLKQMIE